MKILLLLASLAVAGDFQFSTTQTEAYTNKVIIPLLQAAGAKFQTRCSEGSCLIEYTTPDGEDIAFEDKQANMEDLKALAKKLKDKTITPEERDALIDAFILQALGLD